MKKFGFCFLWLLASQGAFAQTPSLSVYFETGKYELAAQEQARLDALMRTLPANAELQLLAYTDDRGDTKTNQVLAHARAGAVSQFLSHQSVALSPQKIQPVGELSLRKDAKMDTEEQRRQNRRVDILVTNFEPKNASEALSYLSRRNTQQFQAPALDRACTFTGKKGTRLSIPANAFALKNADKNNPQPVPPIQIEMREAYSFGDMILQNLSTVSDSQLIQTGGMIYLEAKDALGRGLELAQNKKATWELPNHNPLPEGMQLFTASRQGADNQSTINWNATGQPFVSTAIGNAWLLSKLAEPLNKWTALTHVVYTMKDFLSVNIPIIEPYKEISIPEEPKKCEKPELNLAKSPNLEAFKKQYPKKFFEGRKDYAQRVQGLYDARVQQINSRNQELSQAYEKALADYNTYLKDFDVYITAKTLQGQYNSEYNSSLAKLKEVLNQNIWDMLHHEPILNFTKPSAFASSLLELNKHYQLDVFETPLNELLQEALVTEKTSAAVSVYKKYCDVKSFFAINASNVFTTKFKNTFSPIANEGHFGFDPSLAEKWEFVNDKQEKLKGLTSFSKSCKAMFGNPSFWAPYEEKLQAYSEVKAQDASEINNLIARLETIRQAMYQHPTIIKAIALEAEKAKKIAQTAQMIQNVTDIDGLGWANCDRFTTYPDLMHFTINAKSSADAQYFLVIPTEKVIINLDNNETQVFSPRGYQGLPASKKAKLVGIRIMENGSPEVCVHQSLVSELSNAKLVFRPASLEDLPKILAKI